MFALVLSDFVVKWISPSVLHPGQLGNKGIFKCDLRI